MAAPSAQVILDIFANAAMTERPLRPAGDACAAYAGWLSLRWDELDSESRSLLVNVGAQLQSVASQQGPKSGAVRAGIERFLFDRR